MSPSSVWKTEKPVMTRGTRSRLLCSFLEHKPESLTADFQQRHSRFVFNI